MMTIVKRMVKAEDVRPGQVNYNTWRRAVDQGTGDIDETDGTVCIVWVADGDDREYPELHIEYHPLGTLIPIEDWRP